MKKIYILTFLMAVVVGVSVYFFADALQRQALEKNQVVKGNVVITTRYIPVNTEVTADMVTLADLPVEAINQLSARTVEEVIGAITQYPIEANEQILTTRIKKRGEAAEGRLSYILEPGYRAITIPVDGISGVAGNITQGDYVDLIVTMINPEIDDINPVSFMIIEKLQVLSTGMKVAASTESTAPAEYPSVTLAVTPEQALKISHTAGSGIRLVLRPVLDEESAGNIYYPTVFPETTTQGQPAPAETTVSE